MRRFHSQHAHKKYRPYQSRWKRFLSWRTRRQKNKKKFVYVEDDKNFRKNPYKKRKIVKRKLTIWFKIILFLVITAFWVSLLFFLPFFTVKQVNYEGLENIKQAELEQYLNENFLDHGRFVPTRNYFLINTEKISKKLKENFPIKTLEINKIFPNKLKIKIEEKTSSLIYDNGQSYFLMDNAGNLIKYLSQVKPTEFIAKEFATTTTSTEKEEMVTTTILVHLPDYSGIKQQFGSYPVVFDKRQKSVQLNDSGLLPDNFISGILTINEELPRRGVGEVRYFVLENVNAGIKAITNNSWDAFFQPDNDISSQLNNLEIVLENNKPNEYVDVRYQERVFWR